MAAQEALEPDQPPRSPRRLVSLGKCVSLTHTGLCWTSTPRARWTCGATTPPRSAFPGCSGPPGIKVSGRFGRLRPEQAGKSRMGLRPKATRKCSSRYCTGHVGLTQPSSAPSKFSPELDVYTQGKQGSDCSTTPESDEEL